MRALLPLLLLCAVQADIKDKGYPGWTCDSSIMKPSTKIPTSAHAVRYADIKVIGALGDSLTAANGAGAQHGDPIQVILQYRGLAFQIGGDKGLDGHATVANILRKFNPNLFGYSTGIGSANVWEISKLNQAIPGAESRDLPGQARVLVQLMQNHKDIDIEKDWKLVNIFIGGNDMCAYCNTNGTGAYSAQQFKQNIIDCVNILKASLPRTIVSLTGMFDMGMLRKIDKGKYFCDELHVSECPCEKDKNFPNDQISYACHTYMDVEIDIQNSGVFDSTDDFTFVVQPFFFNVTTPPMNLQTGEVDLTWFAPDCFHFSAFGHSEVGKHLWNNIVQPVGMKSMKVNLSDTTTPLNCPDASCPFFRTTKNSKNCAQFMTD